MVGDGKHWAWEGRYAEQSGLGPSRWTGQGWGLRGLLRGVCPQLGRVKPACCGQTPSEVWAGRGLNPRKAQPGPHQTLTMRVGVSVKKALREESRGADGKGHRGRGGESPSLTPPSLGTSEGHLSSPGARPGARRELPSLWPCEHPLGCVSPSGRALSAGGRALAEGIPCSDP